MLEIVVSEAWRQAYPGAAVGFLAMTGVANPAHHTALEARKRALECDLRVRYGGLERAALREIPTLHAYHAYYKRFRKSYHVQLQLESVVLRRKEIPRSAALVEAMLMAELEDLLLTAGHDLELVRPPVRVDVALGEETYTRLNGQEQVLKAGDMMICDAESILSSIIYGPDRRTAIETGTTQVLYTTYAPPGIGEGPVSEHLAHIRDLVRLTSPNAEVATLKVLGTG
jgi:DNA/RNA-binding domain of Phe-tRNA-synthetase-like protein